MVKPNQTKKSRKGGGGTKGIKGVEERSQVYEHFRSLGLITDGVVPCVQSRGSAFFLTCSVGRTFHIYNVENLGLLFVGPDLEEPIVALTSHEDWTFVALRNNRVLAFERVQQRASYGMEELEKGDQVIQMLVLGDSLLCLSKRSLTVLSLDLKKRRTVMKFADGEASCMLHPHTYLNKVIVGFSHTGAVQLWNFRTASLIHQYTGVMGGCGVTSLSQAPALDVVAVGLDDGQVFLLDAKADERLFGIKASAAVRSLSFRSDTPQMAVGCADGIISIWNLETLVMETFVCLDGVRMALFLPGQSLLLSTGDNVINEWVMEEATGSELRLLKSRSGHSSPPTKIAFFEADGHGLLSVAERDRSVRYTCLLRDSQSYELSQGNVERKAREQKVDPVTLKLPPVHSFAAFSMKDLKWDNLVTAHAGMSSARTWRVTHKTIGKHSLKSSDASVIQAVAMSSCGNFVLLGSASGTLDIFNIQSGILRRSLSTGDSSGTIGVTLDALNTEGILLMASGTLAVFDFARCKVIHQEALPASPLSLAFNPDNGLAAISLSTGQIVVYDLPARRIVRSFPQSTISRALCFSPDGRWIVSAHQEDAMVRTWDLPSGLLVDQFRVRSRPVSIAFSPAGDFLATSHEDDLAIHLWSLKTTVDIPSQMLPDVEMSAVHLGPDKSLGRELIRLSNLPRSRWTQLLHLDAIRARNRTVAPEKPMEKAPFFLDAATNQNKRSSDGSPVEESQQQPLTDSLQLESLLTHQDCAKLLEYLGKAGTSEISFELYSLPSHLLPVLLTFLLEAVNSGQAIDLVQTILSLTLKAHSDVLSSSEECLQLLRELEAAQASLWDGLLEPLLHKALCLTAFCKDKY